MSASETTEPSSSTVLRPNANAAIPDDLEHIDHGPGIYAISTLPFAGEMLAIPAGNLVPIKYNIPTGPSSAGGVRGDVPQEMGHQQQQQQQQQQQEEAAQGQVVVRRFHFAIQIDLMLLFKLVAVIILFNQEGSRQRLVILILFASIIYLYQTGAFTPLLRWLRQAGGAPLMPALPRRQENPPVHANNLPPEGNAPGAGEQEMPIVNEGVAENNEAEGGGRGNGVNWWGIAREMKMLVVSFIASLFPGFHLHND